MNQYPKIIEDQKKGRCIIAAQDYRMQTIIMINPVILIEVDALEDTSLFNAYTMRWTDIYNSIALGLINLLNHSDKPNCELICNYEDLTMMCKTINNINSGDEITIKYACELWFEPVNNN